MILTNAKGTIFKYCFSLSILLNWLVLLKLQLSELYEFIIIIIFALMFLSILLFERKPDTAHRCLCKFCKKPNFTMEIISIATIITFLVVMGIGILIYVCIVDHECPDHTDKSSSISLTLLVILITTFGIYVNIIMALLTTCPYWCPQTFTNQSQANQY